MTAIAADAEHSLNKLIKLFGRPPLLRTDDLKGFQESFAELYAALGPDDFLMDVNVYHLAIETWRAFRFMRYEAAILNKRESDERESWARGASEELFEEEMREVRTKFPDTEDPEYKNAVANARATADAEYKEGVGFGSRDLDYVEAYEHCASSLEKIERQINRALRRRDNILRQIAWSRLTLCKKLQRISDGIIEGTVRQLDASTEVQLIPQAGLNGDQGK